MKVYNLLFSNSIYLHKSYLFGLQSHNNMTLKGETGYKMASDGLERRVSLRNGYGTDCPSQYWTI